MIQKIKTEIIKAWYKRVDKEKYHIIKQDLQLAKTKNKLTSQFKNELKKITNSIENKQILNFKHSGHMGDILYAFPIIKELAKTKKCNLFLNTNKEFDGFSNKHPSGNIMLSERSFSMLKPLIEKQNFINSIDKFSNQNIDIDLDLFRELPTSLHFHTIRWFYHLVGLQPSLNEFYLDVKNHQTITNKIIVVRTFRATNPFIDYSFLNKYDNLLFLGTRIEYDHFIKDVPNIDFYDVNDFLELAEIIKSARFFVSNQTFAYAIAEGLKIPRLLEANPDFPVIYPTGGLGNDFYFQEHFEKYFEDLYQKTKINKVSN